MNKDVRSSQYWRERAAEARAKAGQLRGRVAEAAMRDIARSYDLLAERAAKQEGEVK
jgi:hypothetical protein